MDGTQAQGIRERVRVQDEVSGAGEGTGAKPQHSRDWAPLMPKPENGVGPEDGDGAEVKGIFQGCRQDHRICWCIPNIRHNTGQVFMS